MFILKKVGFAKKPFYQNPQLIITKVKKHSLVFQRLK